MKNKPYIIKSCLGILFAAIFFINCMARSELDTKNINSGAIVADTVEYVTICNNQLPYHWDGIICLTAGIYHSTLTGSNGMDSVVTLQLAVINVGTSITNVSLCSNQLPYSWNGNNYMAEGTYSVTLTSSSGCDSVPILSLTVNNVVTSTTDNAVCTNALPFNWNGIYYNSPGTYTATLTSAAGCDSIATLHLTLKSLSSSTSTVSICNLSLPYYWNGNIYNAAGTYSVTFTASNGCDSVATLILTTGSAAGSTTMQTVCNNQLPYSWNGNSYAVQGTYSVTLTGTAGCDSVATLILTTTSSVTSTTNKTICSGQLPYIWNGTSYSAAGNYQVTLTGSSGCDSVATLHLVVVSGSLSTTTNHSICSTQLPYTWNGNNYTVSSTYTASFINAAGCDSVAILNLTVVTPEVSTDTLIICNEQLPFTWHGNVYTAGGTYPLTPAINVSFCNTVDTLVLIIKIIPPSTTTIHVCNNELPFSWNGNAYNSPGSYAVVLTSSAGCDSVANLDLSVQSFAMSTSNLTICSSQLPYVWNGISCDSTGNYSSTLVNAAGCDSIAILNLVVNPVDTSTTEMIICNAELPFNWNGNSFTSPGLYPVTLTGSNGCDSIATLNLVVASLLTGTSNLAICSNQLPYAWNGNNLIVPGTYTAQLTNAAGCDSMAILNLSVSPAATSISNITTCTSELPYAWNGNDYNVSGTYSISLNSSAGCDSIAILNLIVGNTATSSTTLTICTNQLPYNWNGYSYPLGGTFSAVLTSSSGCDSIAELNLNVTDILTSTTNISVCSSQLPYQWNGNNYSSPGTYSVTMHNANGCDSVPILSLTIVPYVTSTIDFIICNNELPYVWNGNTYNQAGNYTVLLAGSGACDSLITLNLSVNPPVTSTSNLFVCSSEFPYLWNGITYDTTGTYQVTLTGSSGCDSTAILILTELAGSGSTTSVSICSNQLPYVWNGNNYTISGSYSLLFTNNAGCDSAAILNLTVNETMSSSTEAVACSSQLPYFWNGNNYSSGGTYPVVLTTAGGCDSMATLILTVNAPAASTTNISICNSELPYTWNGNIYPAGGTYVTTLTADGGCDSVATLNLIADSAVNSFTTISICNNELPYTWNGNSYSTGGNYTVILASSAGCDSIATLDLLATAQLLSTVNIAVCHSAFPFTWNGNHYDSAGIYQVTLTSSGGCDSTVTLNLADIQASTSITNIIVCSNQLPYTWNGNTYSGNGSYSAILLNAAGCDSIATLNLVIHDTTTSTSYVAVCSNQLPYVWNGNNYAVGGTYAVTLPGAGGCDSIATLNLSAGNSVASTTFISICNSQLPYNWNGNNYSAGGIYSITLTGSGGCDSIATLNLSANSVTSSISTVTLCNSELPYVWNGNSYSAAGNYIVNLTSSGGCDSVATLILTINNPIPTTTQITVCNNQLPYTWNGNSYSVAGIYSVTLTGSGTCDSTAILDLSVTTPSVSTTGISICASQLPYNWNGNNYLTAGIYQATIQTGDGCDSTAILHLDINPVTSSITDTVTCSTQLPFHWNGQFFAGAGTYYVTLANSAGCDSIANLILTVTPVGISTSTATTCSNQLPFSWNGQSYSTGGLHSITLTGIGGCDSIATLNLMINPVVSGWSVASTCSNHLPYSWNGQQLNATGTYTVTLTSAAGCDSVATLQLTVNPVLSSNTNFSICSAELPYLWNGNNYSSSGIFSVILTSAAGCDSVATLNLTVNSTPALPLVAPGPVYCQYDFTDSLSADITSSANHLLWYTAATGGPGSAVPPLPASSSPGNTNYYVSQFNGFCEGPRVGITVTVNRKPDLGPDKDLKICFAKSADLSTVFNIYSLQESWTFNQLPLTNVSNVSAAGSYQLIAVNDFGCADTVDVHLTIQPPVTANAGEDADAEYNVPYQLAGSGNGHYQWSPTELVTDPFIADPMTTLTNDASLVLMVTDDIGCFALDTVKLRVLKGPTFYVPSAFTPNNDGLNDIFRPTAIGIANLEYFRIFNRFGDLVYQTQEINKGWDGNYKGIKQPIGNYVWSLKGTDRTGKVKMLRGNVVLIR